MFILKFRRLYMCIIIFRYQIKYNQYISRDNQEQVFTFIPSTPHNMSSTNYYAAGKRSDSRYYQQQQSSYTKPRGYYAGPQNKQEYYASSSKRSGGRGTDTSYQGGQYDRYYEEEREVESGYYEPYHDQIEEPYSEKNATRAGKSEQDIIDNSKQYEEDYYNQYGQEDGYVSQKYYEGYQYPQRKGYVSRGGSYQSSSRQYQKDPRGATQYQSDSKRAAQSSRAQWPSTSGHKNTDQYYEGAYGKETYKEDTYNGEYYQTSEGYYKNEQPEIESWRAQPDDASKRGGKPTQDVRVGESGKHQYRYLPKKTGRDDSQNEGNPEESGKAISPSGQQSDSKELYENQKMPEQPHRRVFLKDQPEQSVPYSNDPQLKHSQSSQSWESVDETQQEPNIPQEKISVHQVSNQSYERYNHNSYPQQAKTQEVYKRVDKANISYEDVIAKAQKEVYQAVTPSQNVQKQNDFKSPSPQQKVPQPIPTGGTHKAHNTNSKSIDDDQFMQTTLDLLPEPVYKQLDTTPAVPVLSNGQQQVLSDLQLTSNKRSVHQAPITAEQHHPYHQRQNKEERNDQWTREKWQHHQQQLLIQQQQQFRQVQYVPEQIPPPDHNALYIHHRATDQLQIRVQNSSNPRAQVEPDVNSQFQHQQQYQRAQSPPQQEEYFDYGNGKQFYNPNQLSPHDNDGYDHQYGAKAYPHQGSLNVEALTYHPVPLNQSMSAPIDHERYYQEPLHQMQSLPIMNSNAQEFIPSYKKQRVQTHNFNQQFIQQQIPQTFEEDPTAGHAMHLQQQYPTQAQHPHYQQQLLLEKQQQQQMYEHYLLSQQQRAYQQLPYQPSGQEDQFAGRYQYAQQPMERFNYPQQQQYQEQQQFLMMGGSGEYQQQQEKFPNEK